MVIHFCDTNILLGLAFDSDREHKRCFNLFNDLKYTPNYSKRSLDEITKKVQRTRNLFPQIKNYIRDPALIKPTLNQWELKLIESFIDNTNIKLIFFKQPNQAI